MEVQLMHSDMRNEVLMMIGGVWMTDAALLLKSRYHHYLFDKKGGTTGGLQIVVCK
jgi:hypothetical protein